MRLGEVIQAADWKKEKHVPVIDCPDSVTSGEMFEVTVTIGKEVAHPNTTEHHIRWISVTFMPEGAKFAYDLGHFEFNAHGEAVSGPNEGPVYTHHEATFHMKTTQPGTIIASSFCNIHGLWDNSKEIKLS